MTIRAECALLACEVAQIGYSHGTSVLRLHAGKGFEGGWVNYGLGVLDRVGNPKPLCRVEPKTLNKRSIWIISIGTAEI